MGSVTDYDWHELLEEGLPSWVEKRKGVLDFHYLKGNTFEYRKEWGTGRFQRRLRRPRRPFDWTKDPEWRELVAKGGVPPDHM